MLRMWGCLLTIHAELLGCASPDPPCSGKGYLRVTLSAPDRLDRTQPAGVAAVE